MIHFGFILDSFGTLADPSGILAGSTLEPTWNQLGSFYDPSWILDGAPSAHRGTTWFLHGFNLDPEKAFGSTLVRIGSFSDS